VCSWSGDQSNCIETKGSKYGLPASMTSSRLSMKPVLFGFLSIHKRARMTPAATCMVVALCLGRMDLARLMSRRNPVHRAPSSRPMSKTPTSSSSPAIIVSSHNSTGFSRSLYHFIANSWMEAREASQGMYVNIMVGR
jgi:hypothetical protein